MSETHLESDPAVAAATQMQVRHNAEAIADALSTIEVLAGLLQTLEAGARGLALRETSRVCEVSASDREWLEASALQGEVNASFAELRRAFAKLHDGLVLLRGSSADIGSAAEVLEQRSGGQA